jgi:squalene synthase HpnC
VPVDHYENFPVASWLAPAHLRPAIAAIYWFARGADDIADEGDATPAERLAGLDRYGSMLDRIEHGERPAEPPFAALAAAIRAHDLPLAPLRALLSAFRQDVQKARYADFDEVLDYCARSANPIGHLLLHLNGIDTDAARRQADAICTGLQLANFWQDISLDWAKQRVYLPAEDLVRFGVTESQIADGVCNARWTTLLEFEAARARALLESGRPLAAAFPLRMRLELKMVIAGGLRILQAIDTARGDVFRHRPVLNRRDWAAMSFAALRH